mmetsp:Transcript_16045/g.38098  ORF Transcript_16045/g.38098 Transcript_16045/m.38098 type:complete len:225 (+) Transcript_16045:557-1231(+)
MIPTHHIHRSRRTCCFCRFCLCRACRTCRSCHTSRWSTSSPSTCCRLPNPLPIDPSTRASSASMSSGFAPGPGASQNCTNRRDRHPDRGTTPEVLWPWASPQGARSTCREATCPRRLATACPLGVPHASPFCLLSFPHRLLLCLHHLPVGRHEGSTGCPEELSRAPCTWTPRNHPWQLCVAQLLRPHRLHLHQPPRKPPLLLPHRLLWPSSWPFWPFSAPPWPP